MPYHIDMAIHGTADLGGEVTPYELRDKGTLRS